MPYYQRLILLLTIFIMRENDKTMISDIFLAYCKHMNYIEYRVLRLNNVFQFWNLVFYGLGLFLTSIYIGIEHLFWLFSHDLWSREKKIKISKRDSTLQIISNHICCSLRTYISFYFVTGLYFYETVWAITWVSKFFFAQIKMLTTSFDNLETFTMK